MLKNLMLLRVGAKNFGTKHRQLQPSKRERRLLRNQERENRFPQQLPEFSGPFPMVVATRKRSTPKRQTNRCSEALRLSVVAAAPQAVAREVGMVPASIKVQQKDRHMNQAWKGTLVRGFALAGGGLLTLRALGYSDEAQRMVSSLFNHTTGESFGGVPMTWYASVGVASIVLSWFSPHLVQTALTQFFTRVVLAVVGTGRLAVLLIQTVLAGADFGFAFVGKLCNLAAEQDFGLHVLGSTNLTYAPFRRKFASWVKDVRDDWAENDRENKQQGLPPVERNIRSHTFQNSLAWVASFAAILAISWSGYHYKTGAKLPESFAAVRQHMFGKPEVAKEADKKSDAAAPAQADATKDPVKSQKTANAEGAGTHDSGQQSVSVDVKAKDAA